MVVVVVVVVVAAGEKEEEEEESKILLPIIITTRIRMSITNAAPWITQLMLHTSCYTTNASQGYERGRELLCHEQKT